METTNLTELNKAWLNAMQDMFRASMSAMNTMQQEMVRMAKVMQSKNVEAWQQGGSMVDEWIATVQKGQDEFRKLVDENFQRAQDYLEELKKNGGQ
jgi:glutamate/tyrosine decarboxylase-like PLP-dependent enzyme